MYQIDDWILLKNNIDNIVFLIGFRNFKSFFFLHACLMLKDNFLFKNSVNNELS